MSLSTATLQILMSAAEAVPNPGGGVDSHGAGVSKLFQLFDGTGAGKAQKVGDRQIVTSTSITNIDLTAFAGGVGGAAINFTLIKWICFQNLDLVNNVTLTFTGTNGNTNLINGTMVLKPGDALLLEGQGAGYVVDATHKIVGLTAGALTPAVQMTVVGEGS